MTSRLTTLAYVRQGTRTLMLRRGPGYAGEHGRWNGLGGKLEPGETPEECMRREVFEESSLRVEEARYKGLLTFPGFDGETDVYVFVFVVTGFTGEPRASSEGELFWVETAELTALDLWEGDRHFLPWLDEPGTFSAKFRYADGRYLGHEVVRY